jgi:CDP-glucose 4,6-dehydratase
MEKVGVTPSFWAGRRVLVTGHTGFKGSWLSLWLQQLGAEVTGLSLPAASAPALFDLADVGSGIASVYADIRDQLAVARVLRVTRPSVVLHLAAQALVRESYRQPLDTFSTNILGTAHVLEAVRHCDAVRAVVVVTSDKCYRNTDSGRAFIETDPLGGSDPYSSSKAAAELITEAYRASFLSSSAVGVATARAGNVIGGGDWSADRLIPDAVRAWVGGQSLMLRYPGATRPWQHVLEPLRGCLTLVEALVAQPARFSGAWNFGPEAASARTVGAVADAAALCWGGQAAVRLGSNVGEAAEAQQLQLDSSKAWEQLQWQTRWSFNETVEQTMRWYLKWHQGEPMRAFSLAQLAAYEGSAG